MSEPQPLRRRPRKMLWGQAHGDCGRGRNHLHEIEDLGKKSAENRERLGTQFRDTSPRWDSKAAWQAFRNFWLATGSFLSNRVIDDYLSAHENNIIPIP